MLIDSNVFLTAFSVSWNFVMSWFIEGVWVVPLAPAVITIIGSTFQPCCLILSINGWYFWTLLFMVSWENRSLVYVNSINCTVRWSDGFDGGVVWCGIPLIHNMSGLSRALQ